MSTNAQIKPSTVNPIRTYRKAAGKTMVEFAQMIDIHPQAIFLAEQGCYVTILPAIRDYVHSTEEDDALYRGYQLLKRSVNGPLYGISDITLSTLGEPGYNEHPIGMFRKLLGHTVGYPNGLPRMKFAKLFCLQPSELYRLEVLDKKNLSEQFTEAMHEAGLDDTVMEELSYRCQEFAS